MCGVNERMNAYFSIGPSKQLRRPLTIFGLPSQYRKAVNKARFDLLEPAIVAYYSAEAREEVPAILSDPAFLICDELKRLFTLYLPDLQAKIVKLFAGEKNSRESLLYWLAYFPLADCLHKSVERYPDGSVKQIILDSDTLPEIPIFRLGGMLEYKVVVELSVAESILRRSPYGVDLTPVEVK